MQRLADTTVLSPSDLTNLLACEHLTQLGLAVLRGELRRPHRDDPHLDLIRRHGDEHERSYLGELGEGVVRIDLPPDASADELRAAEARTLDAMRAGAPVIFQATFFDGRWRGHADFLRRVETPSPALGAWSYEVLDTKLARQAKPSHVHQLCSYSLHVERLQGVAPARAHLRLGDGTERAFELRELAAVHARARRRLEAVVDGAPADSYPEPVAHCQICEWSWECGKHRDRDDHLSLVANIRREQRAKLEALQLPTLTALADAGPDHPAGDLKAEAFAMLHGQARLQRLTRTTGRRQQRHLAPDRARGYARLPAPDPADLFWDLEGDPFVEEGIEYLWAWERRGDDGRWRYEHRWAHGAREEREVFEGFIDLVVARRAAHPGMHVYHYAPHEASTLKRLAGVHGTREAQVDGLLRDGVLCDLLAVVRQGMQVGEPSYSLKRLERFHGFERRERTVRDGGGSIVAYERWIEEQDPALLEAIRLYNQEDCASTRSLRDWLLERRADAAATLGVDFAALAEPESEAVRGDPEWMAEVLALQGRLEVGLPADPSQDDADQAERRLLAQILLYHRRESLPQWWRFYSLCEMTSVELIGETDAIGGLEHEATVAPPKGSKSDRFRLTLPTQEQRLGLGRVTDPATKKGAGEIVELDPTGSLVLKRGKARAADPLPTALIGRPPLRTDMQREALLAQGRELLGEEAEQHRAVRAILRRERPRTTLAAGAFEVEDCIRAVRDLDDSYLVVQGPPGSGKTYRGARMIVDALARGRRVGVTAVSHKAIHNVLGEVERVAADRGVELRGFHKRSDDPASHYESDAIASKDCNTRPADTALNLVSGTTWLFARPDHDRRFDLLFVDEAGQMALADAACAARAAGSVVLLGDPQQLPQVTQGKHPGSSGCSVLDHLLDGAAVIEPDRGIFLAESWRMHPDVCAFVSDLSYAGQLTAQPSCANRRVDASGALSGAGLRWLRVEHTGNAQASPEEADAIATACEALLADGTVTGADGAARPIVPEDILVVAPYNLAVGCIEGRLTGTGILVGTVDRFQGQEAPVVFFAMASSTGADAPRGLDFLYSRNRLNVAISRAQALAVLVCAPALLDAACAKVEQLALVDGLCRLAERSQLVRSP